MSLSADDRRERREAISESQNHRCAYCGVRFGDGKQALTIDHVTPRRFGGTNHLENLVGACLRCNGLRGCQDAWVFYDSRAWADWQFLPAPRLEWMPGKRATLAAVWPAQRAA